jgi:CheY-like chemotaxis protein
MPASNTILLVDDIADYLEVLELYLPPDCVAVQAASLQEAQQRLAATTVDLAIVDVCLKEKVRDDAPDNRDGLQLLGWIREQYPKVPVIMISAYREFEFEMESLVLGAKCFLRKPVNPAEFAEAVKKSLRE